MLPNTTNRMSRKLVAAIMNKEFFFNLFKIKNKWLLFSIPLGLILIIFAMVSIFGNNEYEIPKKWESGKSSRVPLAVQQSISEIGGLDISNTKVLIIPAKEESNYLVNPNSKTFCGSGGCLYNLYNQKGKLVLSLLLDSSLPKGFESLVTSGLDKERECFDILQAVSDTAVARNEFCKQGEEFFLINTFVEDLKAKNGEINTKPSQPPSSTPTPKAI
jgi:hypothetical protein